MASCLIGRTATVAIRKPGSEPWDVTITFPAGWSKQALLAYVRAEHPGETVRIRSWGEQGLWLANPDGFVNYAIGHRG